MREEQIYEVNHSLPDNGQRVMCFGHKTYCCVEDMDENSDWHEVTFRFNISSYKLKRDIPNDPEESILEKYSLRETWDAECGEGPEHVIGVTKWKRLKENEQTNPGIDFQLPQDIAMKYAEDFDKTLDENMMSDNSHLSDLKNKG